MIYRGQQARKKTKSFKVFNLKTLKSRHFLSWVMLGALGIFAISSGFSYLTNKVAERKAKRAQTTLQKNIAPKRKKVTPLTEEEYKKEKHYSFYNQLEQRSFSVLDKEEIGGEIVTPHVSTVRPNNLPTVQNTAATTTPEMPPIILLSSTQNIDKVKIDEPIQQKTPTQAPLKHSPTFKRLQTGSFISQNEARIQRKLLEAKGFTPQIIEATNAQNKTIYRVQIGPFAPNEINSIKTQLKSMNVNFFETK